MDPKQQCILIFIGAIIAALLLVLIVVLLGGDDGATVASGSTTAPQETSTTETTGATSSSSSSTTTTAPSSTTVTTAAAATTAPPATLGPPPTAPPCLGLPSATIPGPGPGVSFATPDFDGDSVVDQLIGYQDAGGISWVQIALSYGHASQTAVFGPAEALGATNFGSAQDVGYAYVDAGASTQLVGFGYMAGCDFFEATLGGGALARFPIGGGVMHLDGLVCTSDGIVTTSTPTADGITWDYRVTTYLWDPFSGSFVSIDATSSVLTSPADDATIFSASIFDCPFTGVSP